MGIHSFISVAVCNSSWPNPTCDESVGGAWCIIENVYQTTKSDMIFNQGSKNSSFFKNIYIKESTISDIPPNLFTYFPNMVKFHVVNSKLEHINPEIFSNNDKLETIHFESNLLTEIVDYTFQEAYHLNRLYFNDNKIKTVGMRAFSNLDELKLLHLYNNEIESLHVDIFKNNPFLDTLLLGNNLIRNIDFIKYLNKLESLYLNDNRITSINHMLFSRKHNLKELNLGGNCLLHFNVIDFPIKSVIYFNLTSNYLTDISVSGLRTNFPEICVLSIEKNYFGCRELRRIINVVGRSQIDISSLECNNQRNVYEVEDKCREFLTVAESGMIVKSETMIFLREP